MYIKPCIKDILRIGGQQGRKDFLRLDMNENPGGLPSDFVEEVKKELTPEYLAMYPEESRMKKLLADYLSRNIDRDPEQEGCLTERNLCLTNGSDMGIRYLYEVFAEPGSTVVTVAPSFEMYRIYSLVFGLQHRPVVLDDDFDLPVDRILDAIREDTDIVVLLNPNNPVGRSYTEEEFEQITAKAKQVGALVVIDEAYHYFYPKTFLKQALERENVAVLRTFSKLMSLAGCRMGYIAANTQLIEYVNHVRPSFEVNTVALKFGEKLLEQPQLIDQLQKEALDGRAYLTERLSEAGYDTMMQEGNFVFVKPKHRSAAWLAEYLEKEKKILVKSYGNPMLKDYLRISTGARVYMQQFVDAFCQADQLI